MVLTFWHFDIAAFWHPVLRMSGRSDNRNFRWFCVHFEYFGHIFETFWLFGARILTRTIGCAHFGEKPHILIILKLFGTQKVLWTFVAETVTWPFWCVLVLAGCYFWRVFGPQSDFLGLCWILVLFGDFGAFLAVLVLFWVLFGGWERCFA
jgi:hypothetical protein